MWYDVVMHAYILSFPFSLWFLLEVMWICRKMCKNMPSFSFTNVSWYTSILVLVSILVHFFHHFIYFHDFLEQFLFSTERIWIRTFFWWRHFLSRNAHLKQILGLYSSNDPSPRFSMNLVIIQLQINIKPLIPHDLKILRCQIHFFNIH